MSNHDLPTRTAAARGEIAERQPARSKPPSAVLASHLGPYVAIRRLPLRAVHDLLDRMRNLPSAGDYPERWRNHRAAHLAEAEELAAELPARTELTAIAERIRAASEKHAGRVEIARITAAMADGIATFDAERAGGYLDALLFALELEANVDPFSTAALAAGCYETMTRSRFVPEPAALIDSIRAQQKALVSNRRVLELVVDALASLDAAKAERAA